MYPACFPSPRSEAEVEQGRGAGYLLGVACRVRYPSSPRTGPARCTTTHPHIRIRWVDAVRVATPFSSDASPRALDAPRSAGLPACLHEMSLKSAYPLRQHGSSMARRDFARAEVDLGRAPTGISQIAGSDGRGAHVCLTATLNLARVPGCWW